MATINGKMITKNTVVGVSLSTVIAIIILAWTALGIGRPLFASDLANLVAKIDSNQTRTAIQILGIRRSSLQSELRAAKRETRAHPEDSDAQHDVDVIEDHIETIDSKILCHRTVGCIVEDDF